MIGKSWKYYGKDRDQYSKVREAMINDVMAQGDIQINGDNSAYQMYESPEDAGKGTLNLGLEVVLLNPILHWSTATANAGKPLLPGVRLLMGTNI